MSSLVFQPAAVEKVSPVLELRLAALFHDDGRFIAGSGEATGEFHVYQVRSTDGGLTWSEPIWDHGVQCSDETQFMYDPISGEYRFYCKRCLGDETIKAHTRSL